MRIPYNPKNNPRVIIIQKLYGKIFNQDDGEILIKGEKKILKYSKKDEEYCLINLSYFLGKSCFANNQPPD